MGRWPERVDDLRALQGWASRWEEDNIGRLAPGESASAASLSSPPPVSDDVASTSPTTRSFEIAGGADGAGPGPAAGSLEAALLLRRVVRQLNAAEASDAAVRVVEPPPPSAPPLPPSPPPSTPEGIMASTASASEKTWRVVRADPDAIWFSGVPLLRFRLLAPLQKPVIAWAMSLFACVNIFLFAVTPGAVTVTFNREANGHSEDLTFLRYGFPLWLSINVSMGTMAFLYLHLVDRTLFFAVAQSFDFVVIVSCCLVARSSAIYLKFTVLAETGMYDWEWQFWDLLSLVFSGAVISLVVGASDSWQGSRTARLFACFIGCAWFTWQVAEHRFLSPQWPRKTHVAVGLQRFVNPQVIHTSMDTQAAVFLAKGFFALLRGRRFAFIRPFYARETTVEHLQGREVAGDAPVAQVLQVEGLYQPGPESETIEHPPRSRDVELPVNVPGRAMAHVTWAPMMFHTL